MLCTYIKVRAKGVPGGGEINARPKKNPKHPRPVFGVKIWKIASYHFPAFSLRQALDPTWHACITPNPKS